MEDCGTDLMCPCDRTISEQTFIFNCNGGKREIVEFLVEKGAVFTLMSLFSAHSGAKTRGIMRKMEQGKAAANCTPRLTTYAEYPPVQNYAVLRASYLPTEGMREEELGVYRLILDGLKKMWQVQNEVYKEDMKKKGVEIPNATSTHGFTTDMMDSKWCTVGFEGCWGHRCHFCLGWTNDVDATRLLLKYYNPIGVLAVDLVGRADWSCCFLVVSVSGWLLL